MQQCRRTGIGFTAADNAFTAVDDPDAVQAVCDGLTPETISRFVGKWLARLPHPFTVEDEEIAPTAADSIDSAISDVAAALESEGALEVATTEAATGPTGETGEDHGNEDKGGSPPHGEANGHDED